jgi:hypothetical protein
VAQTPRVLRLYMCPVCGEWDRWPGMCDNRNAHPGTPPLLEPITVQVQLTKAGENADVDESTATVEDRGLGSP